MARLIIEELAKAKGMSQSLLQRKSGVTLTMLRRYWKNETESVHLASMDAIARTLGVRVRDLFADEEPPPAKEV